MLIPSHRHRAEDLALWREHEAADLAYYRSGRLADKEREAIQIIRKFSESPCYASISWGKDSTVLADLVARSGIDMPLAWIRVEPIKNPDCEKVRDAFLSTHPKLVGGYFEVERFCTHDSAGWHAKGTLEAGIKECERRFAARHISGVRADESGTRSIACAVYGRASKKSCRPLAWWTAEEVMAYLAGRDMPVHPAYAMLGGGTYARGWLRVASLGGRRGDGMGRAEWEREYYGDVLARLSRSF